MAKQQKVAWESVTFVESDSEPGVEHEIVRAGSAYKCGCMSFRFAKGAIGSVEKTCKHLRAYRISAATGISGQVFIQAIVQPARPVRGAKVVGETFTFRAMAFGRLQMGGGATQ